MLSLAFRACSFSTQILASICFLLLLVMTAIFHYLQTIMSCHKHIWYSKEVIGEFIKGFAGLSCIAMNHMDGAVMLVADPLDKLIGKAAQLVLVQYYNYSNLIWYDVFQNPFESFSLLVEHWGHVIDDLGATSHCLCLVPCHSQSHSLMDVSDLAGEVVALFGCGNMNISNNEFGFGWKVNGLGWCWIGTGWFA